MIKLSDAEAMALSCFIGEHWSAFLRGATDFFNGERG